MRSIVCGVFSILWLLPQVVVAQDTTPAGLWRTIDDVTGKERSIVRIVEVNGEFQGTVEKVFERPGDNPEHCATSAKASGKTSRSSA